MNKHIRVALCMMAAVALLATVSSDVSANRSGGKTKLYGKQQAKTFAISFEYTGSITGDILMDGIRYRIGKNTPVYLIGKGLMDQGVAVTRRSIFLAGEMQGSDAVVTTVIVRPAAEPDDGADRSMHVRVMPDRVPA